MEHYKKCKAFNSFPKVHLIVMEIIPLRLTERIGLRACGTSPKSSLTAGLQIRSKRYIQFATEPDK